MDLSDAREYQREYYEINKSDAKQYQKEYYKNVYKKQFEQYKLDHKERIERDQISNKNILIEFKQMKRYEADKKRLGLV
jgi:hypothetical protein